MPYKRTMRSCANCGAPFLGRPDSIGFCSRACRSAGSRTPGPKPTPPSERMHRFVVKGDDCWGWSGATSGGYGVIGDGIRPNRFTQAHRVAWEMADGSPIPDGYGIYHTCDNRPCTRNDERGTYTVDGVVYPRWGHLFCGPRVANTRDMFQKGRQGDTANHGEAHGRAKLTDAKVREIRLQAASGEQYRDLAREYGVTETLIRFVVQRRIWKHVE